MEKRGEKRIGLTDFTSGDKESVEITKYSGSFGYVGMIHTHPSVNPTHATFSGSGATAHRGKLYDVGFTDMHDVAEAYRRGGISIVVDASGAMFQFEAAAWLREAAQNPDAPRPAGYSVKKVEEP